MIEREFLEVVVANYDETQANNKKLSTLAEGIRMNCDQTALLISKIDSLNSNLVQLIKILKEGK